MIRLRDLILTVGFLGVNLYQQDQYKIMTERAVISANNKEICESSVRFFKYNRTYTAVNVTAKFKRNFAYDLKGDVQVYKFMSNEYRFFPITLTVDICKAMEEDLFGIKNFLWCGNFTKCPINKGTYVICNWGPDYNKFPPNIPSGQYKLDLTIRHGSQSAFTVEWYFKLAYIKLF